ncbi:MAG: hypothetical protein ABTR92_19570 [Candidatus Accumulibacter phosphatis]
MPRVEITGLVITSTHGTLQAGDIVQTSDAFAAHLVDDCRAAKYLDVAPAAATVEAQDTQDTRTTRRGHRSA